LASARRGEELDVIGPLGTPFAVDTDRSKHIIVAGGIGLGPMLFLSSYLTSRNISSRFVFGCRNEGFIPSIKRFTAANPLICTDDGSAGFRGTAADYINANILPDINTDTTIYACGPLPMLKSVSKIAKDRNANCLVSLEAVMACGVGACMGCVVPTVNGYSRVCKEGPIFNGKDVLWERM